LLFGEPKSHGDISCIYGNTRGMARGVLVPRVKSCDESGCERKASALQAIICYGKVIGQSPLLLIENEQALRRDRWNKEEQQCPR
jgi:hypothetical protein